MTTYAANSPTEAYKGAREDFHVYVLLGDANLDPVDGEGRPDALLRRLRDPRLQDARASLRGRGRGGAPSGQSQCLAAPPRAGRCGTAPGGAGRRPDPLLQRLILGWPI